MFAEKLKEARKKRGFTQAQVAELVGIKQPSYSALESGKTLPLRKTKIALAKVLGSNFGDPELDKELVSIEVTPSKKEIVEKMTAKEFVSLKFGNNKLRRSQSQLEMLTKLLDAEIERIKEDEKKYEG